MANFSLNVLHALYIHLSLVIILNKSRLFLIFDISLSWELNSIKTHVLIIVLSVIASWILRLYCEIFTVYVCKYMYVCVYIYICVCVVCVLCAQLVSCVWLFVTPWTVAHQAPLSMAFSRQEYWSGLPFPSPGDLPEPGIKPESPELAGGFIACVRAWMQVDSLPLLHLGCGCVCVCVCVQVGYIFDLLFP